MSRGQIRPGGSICADCSAPDATWASINRGVLICDECCSIHRSLGRHVSQVKSLRKGSWSSAQLQMVHQLVSLGANSIWEHSLLEPSHNKPGKRKPNPRDPVHPTKADFIRAKYQFLSFVTKPKDSEVTSTDDLSKQLHSSVRTGNLETSLRLLSLGADPNYFHTEKGNCPLHVAAGAAQASQVELLLIYGADPGAYDSNGKTPMDHARVEGHTDFAERLNECQFELTDRLAHFLCGRKPDHRTGQNFIIPEMADSSLDLSELAKAAKKKLQALPNHLFEELAMDVYDEVDRRENNQIWLQSQTDNSLVSDRQTVPFLPVNPEFSSTRNQGRQKLARFNAREFATLIIDILSDAKRRQQGIGTPVSSASTPSREKVIFRSTDTIDSNSKKEKGKTSSLSDDEPLYDTVASDEDYASIGDNQSMKDEKGALPDQKVKSPNNNTSESLASSSEAAGDSSNVSVVEFLSIKRALMESQGKVQHLAQTNTDLRQEINLLQNMVHKLVSENESMKRTLNPSMTTVTTVTHVPQQAQLHSSPPQPQQEAGAAASGASPRRSSRSSDHQSDRSSGGSNTRPASMFEPRDHHRHSNKSEDGEGKGSPTHSVGSQSSRTRVEPQGASAHDADYDNPVAGATAELPRRDSRERHSGSTRSSGTKSGGSRSASNEGLGSDVEPGEQGVHLPTQDDVVRKTERITKKIQELLISAQEGKIDSYAACAERINVACNDMATLFPGRVTDERISLALQLLTGGALRLREQCNISADPTIDMRLRTQQVIQCAYDIAKAAKQLVILFE